jgi:hypothetical protein
MICYTRLTDYYDSVFVASPTVASGTNFCLLAREGDYRSYEYTKYDSGMYSQFEVVATANDTTITITPAANAGLDNLQTNVYTVNLSQGEVYQAQSLNATNDVTGTIITSDQPIIVFAGANTGLIGALDSNVLTDEQAPTNSWGDEMLAVSFARRTGGDEYRVLALNDNTVVTTNGRTEVTLQSGQWYDAEIGGPVEFQANNPIQVAHFANGEGYDSPPNYYGEDTEILLPSPNEYSTSYIVYSPSFATNFLNLIVATNAAFTTLDGTNVSLIATNFVAIGSSGYAGAQIPVLP